MSDLDLLVLAMVYRISLRRLRSSSVQQVCSIMLLRVFRVKVPAPP